MTVVYGASTRVGIIHVKLPPKTNTQNDVFPIVDYIFIYKGPEVSLNLNENEVKSIRYVTKEELQELFAQAGKYLHNPNTHSCF